MKRQLAILLRYGGLCVLCIGLLLGVYLLAAVVGQGAPGANRLLQAAAPFYAPPPVCQFADQSFCATEQSFRQLVAATNISDLLERQATVAVTCTAAAQQPACAGTDSGITIQLFAVSEAGTTHLLTRNDYIGYFRSYFAMHGPVRFERDVVIPGGAAMEFTDRTTASNYRLLFQKLRTGWQFTGPRVSPRS